MYTKNRNQLLPPDTMAADVSFPPTGQCCRSYLWIGCVTLMTKTGYGGKPGSLTTPCPASSTANMLLLPPLRCPSAAAAIYKCTTNRAQNSSANGNINNSPPVPCLPVIDFLCTFKKKRGHSRFLRFFSLARSVGDPVICSGVCLPSLSPPPF